MNCKPWIVTLVTVVALAAVTVTLGCAGKPKPVSETSAAPAPVEEAGLEELTVPQIQEKEPSQLATSSPGRLYTLRIRDGRLKDLLLALARESRENLVVGPEVTGEVTLDLNRVTLEQALDAILTPLGYIYWKAGPFIRISKPAMETRLFTLNYISTSRKSEKKILASHGTSAAKGGKVSGSESSIVVVDQHDPWVEIQEGLTAIVFGDEEARAVVAARDKGAVTSLTSKEGKKLVISRMTGVILVRDYPEKLQEAARFLELVEGSAQRQVLIRAQIFEVSLNKEYNTGVRWDNIQQKLLNLDIANLNFSYDIAGEASRSGILAVTGTATSFNMSELVQALEVQGKVNTLASPRVATLNNQTAVVKITDQDVYFESETTLSEGIQQTTFTPNVVDIGVILDVTPQIAADGSIVMDIHPSFSEKLKDVEVPASIVGGTVTSFPLLSVRETDTVVRVRDGQSIIIAGLIKDRKKDTRTGLPCLMSMPVLGHLFRYTTQETEKKELVIVLTPTVLVGKRIDALSAEDLERMETLRQRRYPK